MTITDLSPIARVARIALRQPGTAALIAEDREVDYATLVDETARLVAGLRTRGVQEGSLVGYLGLNSIEFVTTYLATTWIGAVFVPINFRLAADEIASLVDDCGLDVLIAEPALAQLVDPELPLMRVGHAVVTRESEHPLWNEWSLLQSVVASGDPDAGPMSRRGEDDLSILMYTSGTTGKSKGVKLSYGNIWWNQVNVDSTLDTRIDDVNLAIAPLFHIGALNSFTLRTLTRGGTTVLRRGFDAAATLADIEHFGVTSFFAVPTMFAQLARDPGFAGTDLTSLRAVVVAAAPVPPSVIKTWAERGVLLQQAWGLTETAPFATWVPAGRALDKLGSAGIPMPFTEVTVLDLESREPIRRPGHSGELAVRGPNVVTGYWRNEAADRAAFTDDGWFLTGDIGYADDEGYIYIIDRLKDMIITGGENVYPAEVERVLAAHPLLTDSAVVGSPDAKWGECVVAVVSTVDGRTVSLEDVRAFCADRLARYKLPTRVEIIEKVPRNASGKLDKAAIRRLVADREGVAS